MKINKIIGVGFQKTGTSTLRAALEILGYSVLGPRTDLATALADGDWDAIYKESNGYDALEDNPWAVCFKELDLKYPNSKFILTIRNKDKWIQSFFNHFGNTSTKMREYIYGDNNGDPLGKEAIYLKRYTDHIIEVKKYFKDRPNDLLIMYMEKGYGWLEICEFLNCKIPRKKFPHVNKGAYSTKEKVLKFLKKKFRTFLKLDK